MENLEEVSSCVCCIGSAAAQQIIAAWHAGSYGSLEIALHWLGDRKREAESNAVCISRGGSAAGRTQCKAQSFWKQHICNTLYTFQASCDGMNSATAGLSACRLDMHSSSLSMSKRDLPNHLSCHTQTGAPAAAGSIARPDGGSASAGHAPAPRLAAPVPRQQDFRPDSA